MCFRQCKIILTILTVLENVVCWALCWNNMYTFFIFLPWNCKINHNGIIWVYGLWEYTSHFSQFYCFADFSQHLETWFASLSTASIQEGPESVSVHCNKEVVWWRKSSREEHQWTKEHMWPSVSSIAMHFILINEAHATPCILYAMPLTLPFCHTRYPPEAPELQIRKMADLCLLVQHYDLAYSCYHTAKKDFLSDQAMLYAAGALVRAHMLVYTMICLQTVMISEQLLLPFVVKSHFN